MSTTFNLSDIVSNQSAAAPTSAPAGAPASAPAGGTFKLTDIASNQGPDTTAPSAPSFLDKVGAGISEGAHDIYGVAKGMIPNVPGGPAETGALRTIWNQLPPVEFADSVKQTLPLIDAYEKSRSGGASVGDSLKAVNEAAKQHMSNVIQIKPVVDAFRANPTRETARALTDAAALAASMFVGGEVAGPEAEAAAVTPEAETADTVASWLKNMNPFRKAAATPADAAAIADKTAPIDVKTAQTVGKVAGQTGMPEGRAATSDVETEQMVSAQSAKQAAEQAAAGKQTQSTLQNGIRDVWNKVADDNGVPRPAANASIRDAGQQVGDNIIAQAKEIIKPLDDATGGKFSANDTKLRDVNMKLKRVTSLDDEDKLISEKQQLLWAQDDLLKQAEVAGVPQDTLSTFKTKYRTGQSIYDQNQHIRMTTTGLPAEVAGASADPEVVKSSNLMQRLVKDYSPEEGGKPGRLVQGLGEENAQQLLNRVSQARVSENQIASTVIDTTPGFQGLPATEKNALRNIVRPHVTAGRFGGVGVDLKGVLKDFDQLTTAERNARFADPAAIRAELRHQATIHNLKVYGGSSVAGLTGAAGTIWHFTQ